MATVIHSLPGYTLAYTQFGSKAHIWPARKRGHAQPLSACGKERPERTFQTVRLDALCGLCQRASVGWAPGYPKPVLP